MRDEYDFTDSDQNPYVGKPRNRVTINLDSETVDYFKEEARRTGASYQNIISLFLYRCAREDKHL